MCNCLAITRHRTINGLEQIRLRFYFSDSEVMVSKEYQIWYFPIRAIYNSDPLFSKVTKARTVYGFFGYKGELGIPSTVL